MDKSSHPIIFVLGPQGSGKSTQARILAGKLGIFYWEMSAVLHDAYEANPDIAAEAKEAESRGVLLSDEIIIKVCTWKLAGIPLDQGILFSGVPRRMGQAQFILEFVREKGYTDLISLFVDLPKEEGVKRLMLRAQNEGRSDDTPEGIAFRLQQYEDAIAPVMAYLKKETTFVTVDGSPPIEEVTAAIDRALGLSS